MSFKLKFAMLCIAGLVMSIVFSNPILAIVSLAGFTFIKSYKQGFRTANQYFDLDIIGAFQALQKEAETIIGPENYAYNLKRKTGGLDFITSPENGSLDNSLITYDQQRKIAKLEIFYDQRTKPCQIITNCGDADQGICAATGATPIRKRAEVTIANCIKTPVRIYYNNDMVALAKDTQGFIRDRMMNDIRAAHEALSIQVLAELDGQIGKNVEHDGTSTAAGQYKPIQLLAVESGQRIPKPGNWAEVLLDYANNQLTGQPAVIGQGNIEYFLKLHGMSCCNSTTPYGEANVDGDARFYLDQAANSVLGTSGSGNTVSTNFILAAFKAVHMLTFNENRNINLIDKTRAHFVIPDPLYPFDWNIDFVFDCDLKAWKNQLSLTYGFFNVFQADSFAADGEDTSPDASPDCNDELDGMTGVFGYTATAS
jgi:hypothetical protein